MTDIQYSNSPVQKINLRFADDGDEVQADIGFFEGYAVTWNSIDSYNSTFKRGCFAKTLTERKGNIKLLWNHENGIGQPLTIIGTIPELREDDIGLFVRAKLALDVVKGSESYALMKTKAINTLSFGFRVIDHEKNKEGVTVFNEVELLEISPVGFEANKTARISQVRKDNTTDDLFNGDKPAEKIEEITTVETEDVPTPEVRVEGAVNLFKNQLLDDSRESLLIHFTDMLMQLWWEYGSARMTGEQLTSDITQLIDTFKKQYLEATKQTIALFENEGRATDLPIAEGIPQRMLAYLIDSKQTPNDLAINSQLTLTEIRSIGQNQLIKNEQRLKDIDVDLWECHKSEHQTRLQSAITELKGLTKSGEDVAQIKEAFELREMKPVQTSEFDAIAKDILKEIRTNKRS